MRDAGHDPALNVGEQGAEQVQPAQKQQNAGQGVKVDGAGTGDHGHEALKEFGGGLAQDLGAQDGEGGAGNGAHQRENHHGKVAIHVF